MILGNKVQVLRYTFTNDQYGGKQRSLLSTSTINAKVSVASDDLKAQPSGMGYYRTITLITYIDSGILTGDEITYNGVRYIIEGSVPMKGDRFKCFKGYEL